MLALETGWTPDVIADLPLPFRLACHWAIYARVVSGPEGLPNTEVDRSAPPAVRIAAMKQAAATAELRKILFPEDDDGNA